MFVEDYRALKPSRYSYTDINQKITHQFKDKLGQQVYGTMYKEKILNNSRGNGDEFINEVTTMGTMHHVNACSLLSWLLCLQI